MTDELKLCPFCGVNDGLHRAHTEVHYGVQELYFYVTCPNCYMKGPTIWAKRPPELTAELLDSNRLRAIAAWNNTRPLEDALRKQLASRDALIERLVEADETIVADAFESEGRVQLKNIQAIQALIAEYRATVSRTDSVGGVE